MSDLDNKLREIVKPHLGRDVEWRPVIEAIKQAFADEGYVPLFKFEPKEGEETLYEPEGTVMMVDSMTGQAFYDRFVTESGKLPADTPNYPEILETAKRAAGLE